MAIVLVTESIRTNSVLVSEMSWVSCVWTMYFRENRVAITVICWQNSLLLL